MGKRFSAELMISLYIAQLGDKNHKIRTVFLRAFRAGGVPEVALFLRKALRLEEQAEIFIPLAGFGEGAFIDFTEKAAVEH